jgi:hypothetical protein
MAHVLGFWVLDQTRKLTRPDNLTQNRASDTPSAESTRYQILDGTTASVLSCWQELMSFASERACSNPLLSELHFVLALA